MAPPSSGGGSSSSSFNEFTAIEEVGPGQFRSKNLPQSSGNAAMAYGGFTLAVAVRAAYATVMAAPPPALYSLLGHYLGPALTSAPLQCAVHAERTTRTFATRRVEVRQARPDGTVRLCLVVLADFHAAEPSALLTYSAPPARAYAGPADQPAGFAGAGSAADDEGEGGVVEDGKEEDEGGRKKKEEKDGDRQVGGGEAASLLTPALAGLTALTERFFETRACREGVAYQNRHGALKHVRTTQEHLAPTARTAAEWHRARPTDDDEEAGSKTTTTPTPTPADQAAAAAFLLDGGLAFLPLTLHHAWFDDVAACSSLDVALRFLTPALDLAGGGAWHLRERTSPAAGAGRSYAEARLWHADGTLVAVMTQQGILRPTAPRAAAKM